MFMIHYHIFFSQVYDKDVLPGYHFRDDALLLYDAINKYVKNYVDLYYGEQK